MRRKKSKERKRRRSGIRFLLTLFAFSYEYDGNGNRTAKTGISRAVLGSNALDISYCYDVRGQLLEEKCGDNSTRYVYDKAGNRILKTDAHGKTAYRYNAKNQLVHLKNAEEEKHFLYDKQGGIIEEKTSRGTFQFSYNSRHQQTRVETAAGNVQENHYDAEGLRFELLENGTRTGFVYHGSELLCESGQTDTHYHIGMGIHALERENNLFYYHQDEQLNTAFVTNQTGMVANSYTYDAFGAPVETAEQISNRIRYTGQQYDTLTGQYYLRARYYNPALGRFLQEDSYLGDGLNLYAYCGNNPVVYYDPSGYEEQRGCVEAKRGDDREGIENRKETDSSSDLDRIRNVAQQSYDYAVDNPRREGLNRMQLGKDAEIQATRWTRKWAERNGIDLSENGLHFQVRGNHSIPDVIYEPTKTIMDFKLTPKAIRKKQSNNFKNDFPGYSIEYIFGPGPWRGKNEH